MRSGFKPNKVTKIERTNYINSVEGKTGDLTFETTNKLVKEGERDAWFSLIREDINDMDLQSIQSHNTCIKERLFDMLDKSIHNLQTNDYEDTDSTTYQKLTEISGLVKSQDKLEPHKYSKLHRSFLEFMSIL